MHKKHPAQWWEPQVNGKILCTLCPRFCTMGEGQHGFCYIRKNEDGKLITLGYGHPTGFASDPIEKKPLYHFLPGSQILSFGTAGCNLGCKFCQNWHMSKAIDAHNEHQYYEPETVVQIAQDHKIPSIAFTYNDPVIFGEYVIDIAAIARQEAIKTVMVTAGYVEEKARKEIFQNIDAANVDLKSFSEHFYHTMTYSHLSPVLDTLLYVKKETEVWLEITTLLIPGHNDGNDEIKKMCDWILTNLGDTTPLHFTAFHPDFRLTNVARTPIETLITARNIALESGIKFCYLGNVYHAESSNTTCPECNTIVIHRSNNRISSKVNNNNCCNQCGHQIAGIFIEEHP